MGEKVKPGDDEKVALSFGEAVAMLPESDRVHTFRGGGMILVGCDWDRDDILELFRKYEPKLSGPTATSMGYGIVIIDDAGPLFIKSMKTSPLKRWARAAFGFICDGD